MLEDSAVVPMCDVHHDAVAQAICHNHTKLLCLKCVLDKAKSPDCSVKEMPKQSDEKDTMLLQCILVRQMVQKKTRSLEKHEAKTDALKKELEQKVVDMHENLTKRLAEMKENCLKQIDESAKNVTSGNDVYKSKLCSFETIMDEQLDMLKSESVEDLSHIIIQVKDVQKKLEDIPEREKPPEGQFTPNDRFDKVMKPGALLGEVYLMDHGHYHKIVEDFLDANTTPSKPIYSTSDEIKEKKITRKNGSPETGANEKTKASNVTQIDAKSPNSKCQQSENISDKSRSKSHGAKLEKKSGGFFNFNFFSSEKKKSDQLDYQGKDRTVKKRPALETGNGAGKIYEESTFYTPSYVLPKSLINKTVMVSALKEQFESSCKFSKLVDLGDGYIGMLSKIHKSLVVVGTNGQMYGAKKTFKDGQLAIVATGSQSLAVIAESGLQVTKFKIGDKGMSTAGSVLMKEEIANITGFDFDVDSSTFAVTTPNQVFLLDKNGRKVKALQHDKENVPKTFEMTTVYDFSKKLLYILKIKDKSLKCYSFDKSAALWKKRLGDQSFTPRSMCLYNDKLCIACGKSVAVFSASSGEPLNKYDVKNLLDDCLGLCVIDDVIVLSSNSESLDESATLAFICI